MRRVVWIAPVCDGKRMTIVERACMTLQRFAAIGNEVFETAGATFVRNRTCPRRYDANFIAGIRCDTSAALAHLMQTAEREFGDFGHRRFDVDPLTPAIVAAHLAFADYEVTEFVHLLLGGELSVTPRPVAIRAVEGEDDWRAYAALLERDWRETVAASRQGFNPETTRQFMISKRTKVPEVTHWLALVDGVPRAYGSSWPGCAGMGIVDDLFTEPEYRHRGLATALIARGVAHARAHGAGPILIGAFTDDTPKHMYAAMGFRPLMLTRQYLRVL